MKPLLKTLTLVIISISVFGQLPDLHFETITSRDGLPSNTVFSATKDKKGFMWFGTRLCPVRYDGKTFTSFTNPQTNLVTGVACDKLNTIWLSSDKNGICSIKPDSLKMNSIPKEVEGSTGHFYIDKHGTGWYSDFSGVNKLNLATKKIVHYPFQKTPFIWNKGSFIEDQKNNLWIMGGDNGLFQYDPKRDTLLCLLGKDCKDQNRNDSIIFSTGYVDHNGTLWLGTYNRGLIKYNTKTNEYKYINTGSVTNQVTAISEGVDENGKIILWIGDDRGLGIFRPEQNKFYFFTGIFSHGFEVNSIFRDNDQGIVWVCTSEGLIKYHPKSNLIKAITIPSSIISDKAFVTCFLQDNKFDNIYYIGLSNTGMINWNSLTNEFKLINFPVKQVEIRWMTQRADGKIWIGTNRWDYVRPGIFIYDPEKKLFITNELSILANKFFSVPFFMYGFFDKKDRLWIGNSDEGIHVLDEITNTEVTPWKDTAFKNLINKNNLLNCMLSDRHGRILIGMYNGIFYVDDKNGKFISLNQKQNDYPTVNSLLVDKKETLWAARWGGLTGSTLNGNVHTMITTEDGFYDHETRGLAEDFQGNIWTGNYEGIYYYRPSTKKLVRFTVNDGLLNNTTTHGLLASHDGRKIFIAQTNGFNIVNTDQLRETVYDTTLAVSNFYVHNKPYAADLSKTITLRRTDNAFSADFIALNYRKHHDNKYAYYLEGLEDNWNYSGSEHHANYTNLNPGLYTLHIKTSDAFGNWSTKMLQLKIRVLPAYYETWWFKVLMVIAVMILLYSIYQYRIQQLLNLQHVRNRISADLHDELGASLSGISIMGTLAKKTMADTHPSSTFVSRIVEEIQNISTTLDDIVWSISPKNDELSSLIARMTRYASELFEAKQIKYSLSVPENIDHVLLSMEQRRNLYLVFKEAVNNLVKYSQCANACIKIMMTPKLVTLNIHDDGIGFDTSKQSDRNGIRNMKERARSLHGELKIESLPGKTNINLEFPIK